MRKPLVFSLTLLAATALLLVGCNPILPSEGNKVKFKAHSKSQPATKTAYAGYDAASTGSSHEDIYWSKGDDIRIYSGNTAVVTPAFANYELVISNDKTRATLQNPAEAPNGLAWVTDPAQGNDDVTFYAVYPPSTQGSESGWFTMSIPSEQTFATPTGTDMTHAYMLAQNTLTRSQFNSEVSLEFYPAFTAFQINLKSKDDELTLKKFRIYSEDNHLAGDYYGKLIAVNDSEKGNEYFAFNFEKTLRMDFACVLDDNNQPTSLQNEVSVEFPFVEDANTGTRTYTEKISSDKAVDFTLLALPYGIVNATETYDTKPYLTNLWLEVSYWKNDSQGKPTGDLIKKKLALKQTTTTTVGEETTTTTNFYKFASCKKYRINGLAVDGGDKWRLSIDGKILPWTYYKEELTSLDQINVYSVQDPITGSYHTVSITGSIETTQEWRDAHNGSTNHEIAYQGYSRYYQVRTLNWNLPVSPLNKQFIEMSFLPQAPIGGYWQMVPEFLGTNSDKHFSFQVKTEGVTDWEVQDAPHGQILNHMVYVRIYPKDWEGDLNTYEMILKSYFSPNHNFDPTYSADSELQDMHGNGQFSYWRFRLEKGSGTYTPDREHESLIAH